jgi:hypothetical protein
VDQVVLGLWLLQAEEQEVKQDQQHSLILQLDTIFAPLVEQEEIHLQTGLIL